MDNLWERVNYIADISYLTNVFVTEYDISKANINVLYTYGAISKEIYDWLYDAKKIVREKYIGMLQREDRKYTDTLKKGIIEAKRQFFQANQIQDREVLSIKNDAVFLINRTPDITKFGLIEFKKKSTYSSFYKIQNLEMYYFYNPITKEEFIEVKGISDKNLELHKNGFLQILMDVFCTIQTDGVLAAIEMVKNIHRMYVNLEFPVEVYRSFNARSMYHYKMRSNMGTGFMTDNPSESYKHMLDISANLSVLIELNKILYTMYFA